MIAALGVFYLTGHPGFFTFFHHGLTSAAVNRRKSLTVTSRGHYYGGTSITLRKKTCSLVF